MPVRFQVDADFYDHPKTLDISDAAVALWTRAGSYSAAKLLDGYVPDAKLASLSKVSDEASAELVRHRLWRRVRGGFQFHQYDERNLTRARIEADRSREREKKRRQRSDGPADGHPQAADDSVPRGHGRDIPGTPAGVPGLSVSVSESVSVSVSGSGHAVSPPPPRCPQHLDDPDPPACGRCAEARKVRARWDATDAVIAADRRRTAPKCPHHRGQPADKCGLCRAEKLAGDA